MMQLHGYFRSSAAYRVRIALNLKKIDYNQVIVNLLSNDQRSSEYLQKNPQGLIPFLEAEDGGLGQSLAIMEWLESMYPEPSLLPGSPWEQAQIRSLSYAVACDIHPLNNLRVLNYLKNQLNTDDHAKQAWYAHWIQTGFDALEKQVGKQFCLGENPTMADVCLIPQVYNALRFQVPVEKYPNILSIYEHCNTLPAFIEARPDNQPDAP